MNDNNLKPFAKGKDPRRNTKGRISTPDKFKALVIRLANEMATAKGEPITIDGEPLTNAEMILRQWMKDPRNQEKFIQYAFGKVPDKIDVNGDHKIELLVKYEKPDNSPT